MYDQLSMKTEHFFIFMGTTLLWRYFNHLYTFVYRVTSHSQFIIVNNNFFLPAPPSYSECVFGKVNVKDEGDSQYTRGVLEFAPVYTYYDWGHQPTTMSGK